MQTVTLVHVHSSMGLKGWSRHRTQSAFCMQSKAIKVSEPIAGVPTAELPHDSAQCFRSAQIGDLHISVGDVVELEDDDDDESADESADALLGLVQCMWHEGKAADAELQVCHSATARSGACRYIILLCSNSGTRASCCTHCVQSCLQRLALRNQLTTMNVVNFLVYVAGARDGAGRGDGFG